MAVNVKGTNFTDNQSTYTPQEQQPRRSQGNTPFNLSSQFGIASRLSIFGSGGETYEKLYEKIQKRVKFLNEELKTEERYSVIKLLKTDAGPNYSSIIITETAGTATSAHVLMVERTGNYPEKLVQNIAGIRYEIIRTPADALDERYIAQVRQLVSEALKIELDTITVVDGTLVPNEFDINSDIQAGDLISNGFNAIRSENVIRTTGYKGINLVDLATQAPNGKFIVNLYFNPEESSFLDQSGLPVRQDVCIALSYKVGGNSTDYKSINQNNDTYELVKTYGYIDFEFTGPTVINNTLSTQKFLPNFVITHVDSPKAPTPDIMMLGVVSVLALNEDLNWMQAFRSTPNRKETDYNDIGGLNIEGNIENAQIGFGKKYDTKSKTFTVGELNKLIQLLVRPNLLISVDVPKAGPETWYTSIFQHIKNAPNGGGYRRLVDSILALTNGQFVAGNVPVFAEISNKIYGGFYKTKDGVKDIRHLTTYLAVANHVSATNQSPALLSQYTNTLYNTAIPPELRAANRRQLIDEMSNGSAVYKQYYDRLTFNAGFLVNLANSFKSVGFNPIFSNLGTVNDMFVRRNSADFTAAMLGNDVRLMGQNNQYGNFLMPYGYNRTY